ncbi:MAG TPA: efflux RND transporter periplasmic adaptor subunit [Gemmatimonadaceae bacterium]|jgi:RND family efflux transporter MFP subunit|nr:efflux RND transporter periplasmic adaptor subunit [Gemmatimonadaceae bacterium]
MKHVRTISFIILVAVALLVGGLPRIARARRLAAAASARSSSAVGVLVATVHRAAASSDLALPGTVEALHEASVYAQTAGYVKRWTVDMGAHVKSGQIMAQISTPEVDQQLEAARATLARAQATLLLNRTNLVRWKDLVRDSAVSKLELDEHQAAFDDANAAVMADEADVRRLSALQQFSYIVAPFSGVVTSRSLDVGQYVSAASAGPATSGIGRGLYTLAQIDTVRLLVNVPQSVSSAITVGQHAAVSVAERPGRTFTGTVSRTSEALDPASRTLLVEVRILNTDGALVPGLYADVHFQIDRSAAPLLVTANALVTRSDGPQVVEVRSDSTAHFSPIRLGRDYGSEVELTDGVTEGATVVVNPSDDVIEGARLRVVNYSDRPNSASSDTRVIK